MLPFDFRTPNDGGRRKQPSTIFVANGRSTSGLDFADIVSESVDRGRHAEDVQGLPAACLTTEAATINADLLAFIKA